MYLSCLLIHVGTNPDRPRPGRLWLRNIYRVHQRLCMGFPSRERKAQDPNFLNPYRPSDFISGQYPTIRPQQNTFSGEEKAVHVPRNRTQGFLYRVDPLPGTGRTMVLVQSGLMPDWNYAFQNAYHILGAPPEVKPYDPQFEAGQCLRFRIVANPLRKVSKNSVDSSSKPFEEVWQGKEVPVPTTELDKWLKRRAEPDWTATRNSESAQLPPGFRLQTISSIQTGYVYANHDQNKTSGRRIRSARYEGSLIVTDADNFRNTIARGIGPGKAFGFGLLSVAPI